MYKFIMYIWLLFAGAPALGYVKHLYDEDENKSGAVAVFIIVIATAIAVYLL